MLSYFARLAPGKIALWCYLIWYAITVIRYFDPSLTLWLNSIGISVVIGIALLLSVSGSSARADRWQTFRLFMMPFGVSSFAALIKDQGFILIFPPTMAENVLALAACAAFVGIVLLLKICRRKDSSGRDPIAD
jgi:hypothetical protein